jgi:DNA polymerase III delta subunit
VITVLTGENVNELQKHLMRMKKEFVALRGESGVETVSGETLKKEQIAGLLHGATLFSSHRFVILKHSAQNKEVAAEMILQLPSVSAETHLVLVEPSLDKRTVFF